MSIVGVVDDRHAVGREDLGRERDAAIAADVANRHACDLEATPGAERDVVAVLVDQPDDGRTDVAAAQHADTHDLFAHHGPGPSAIHADMRISSS